MIRMCSFDNLIQQVKTQKKIYEMYLPLTKSEEEQLLKLERYKIVYTSNRLEGNRFSEYATQVFLDKGLLSSSYTLKETNEIYNLNKAVEFCDSYTGDITIDFIKKLHLMTCVNTLDTLDDCGNFRKVRNFVGNIVTSPVHAIDKHMNELIEWYNSNKDSKEGISLAVGFKYRFLVIHPFVDGNGRISRLLLNLILKRKGYLGIIIDDLAREDYYKALAECDYKTKRCKSLEDFVSRLLIQSYKNRIEKLK